MNPAQLAREDPARLVRLFQQAERRSRRAPGDLLAIACQLLHLATNGLVVSRGCTRITFEFEGYRTHTVVTLVAVTDSKEEFILALARAINAEGPRYQTASISGLQPPRGGSLGLDVSKAEGLLGRRLPILQEVVEVLAEGNP